MPHHAGKGSGVADWLCENTNDGDAILSAGAEQRVKPRLALSIDPDAI